MAVPGVFYGGGCSYMACRGLMMSGISDVLLITHGPVGCAYYSGIDPYRGDDAEPPAHAGHCFTTNLTDADIIFGGEAKLAEAIDEAVERYRPAAIAICATCPVGLIGDDIGQVARDASRRHGIDVLPLSCEGFKAEPGWLHAGKQMFSQWVGRASGPTGPFPIHFMSESFKGPERGRIASLLERIGYDVVCSLMGATTYSEIMRSQDARLVVLDSGKAIDLVPLMYREKYGSGFMRVGFTGLGNIEASLMAMAGFFGDKGLMERTRMVVDDELARISPHLEQARRQVAGTTVAVFEDIFRSNDYATLSLELGMNVIMVSPDYAAESYTDEGFTVHVPTQFAARAFDAAGVDEASACEVDRIPGCENAAVPDAEHPPMWLRFVASRDQVGALLHAIGPDLCFAGVEERFGNLSCPLRNGRFLSDERGCDYSGFDGFGQYARDLAIARHMGRLTADVPRWAEGRTHA